MCARLNISDCALNTPPGRSGSDATASDLHVVGRLPLPKQRAVNKARSKCVLELNFLLNPKAEIIVTFSNYSVSLNRKPTKKKLIVKMIFVQI